MALSATQRAAREGKIGTSFFNILMKGDAERIHNEWLGVIGDPSYKPFRLNRWQEVYGAAIEPVAIDYHEEKTQCELTRRGEQVVHPHRPYVITTLDCWRATDSTCLDVKGYSSFYPADEVIRDVTPQLHGQVGCTGALNAAILLVHGGGEPAEIEVKLDPDYDRVLWEKVDLFWDCCERLITPVDIPDLIKPVIPPEQWRTINLDNEADRNACNWAADIINRLEIWQGNKAGADIFEKAKSDIKLMLPDDVARVTYSGMFVRRARNNAITIGQGR